LQRRGSLAGVSGATTITIGTPQRRAMATLLLAAAALFWLLAWGGAGIYLCCMDVLYDLEHGVWGKGANGLDELAVKVLTLALSLFFLHWAWVRRDAR
jgi:hypothetical protein